MHVERWRSVELTIERELWRLSAEDVALGVKGKRFSAREVTEAALSRIDDVSPRIRAIVDHDPERSLAAAEQVDAKIAEGKDPGPLAGVPVTIKVGNDQAGYA